MTTKQVWRRRLLTQRMGLTPAEIAHKSAGILDHVCVLPAFCASHTVMMYIAMAKEVQTRQLLAQARQLRKRVAVPVVCGSRLIAVEWLGEHAPLQRSPLGMLEPAAPHTIIPPQELDCVLVPGVAFDLAGGRLGFGKGYYDRFLGQLPTTTYRCGVAFSIQVVSCVPQEAHDVSMHGLVTEQGYRPCVDIPPPADHPEACGGVNT